MSAAPDPQKCPAHAAHNWMLATIIGVGGLLIAVVFGLLWDMRGTVCEMRGTLGRITTDVEQIKAAVAPPARSAALVETKPAPTPCAVARPITPEYP